MSQSFWYDSSLFSQVAQVVSEELSAHLRDMHASSHSVIRSFSPSELVDRAFHYLKGPEVLPNSEAAVVSRARELAREFLSSTTHLHSPFYMGHQVPPPVPVAAVFSALGAALNPGLAVFEMSQFASAIERALISKLGAKIDWAGSEWDGIITSGGTLANLTAILSARNWKFPDAFSHGLKGRHPAILASTDSHYSVSRAAGVLGFGAEQVVKVPVDSQRRMDPRHLPQVFSEARSRGLEPFCIVAASGSTPFGAFDPLAEIARFAGEHDLWLHVDGAHGGSLLFSERFRPLFAGIEEADSVTWDAHKMMFVPSLCTFLFYRDRRDSYRPFQQEAPYIFSGDDSEPASWDAGLRTFECTKGPIALPTWALWSLFSEKIFSVLIEGVIDSTRTLHQMVEDAGDFTALHKPECNILCFRYTPPKTAQMTVEEVGYMQKQIRKRLVNDGRFYITGTMIDGAYALRTTVINPATDERHLVELLNTIRDFAKRDEFDEKA